jgi:hypothetical protein
VENKAKSLILLGQTDAGVRQISGFAQQISGRRRGKVDIGAR